MMSISDFGSHGSRIYSLPVKLNGVFTPPFGKDAFHRVPEMIWADKWDAVVTRPYRDY